MACWWADRSAVPDRLLGARRGGGRERVKSHRQWLLSLELCSDWYAARRNLRRQGRGCGHLRGQARRRIRSSPRLWQGRRCVGERQVQLELEHLLPSAGGHGAELPAFLQRHGDEVGLDGRRWVRIRLLRQ